MKKITISRCFMAALAALMMICCDDGVGYLSVVKPVYKQDIRYGIAIESAADLKKIGADEDFPLDGAYYLSGNINLNGEEWTPLGPDAAHPFSGMFDGDGRTISGLRLPGGDRQYIGLFGYLSGARIANLTIDLANASAEIIELTGAGEQDIGVVAAYSTYSSIYNVSVKGGEGKGLAVNKTAGGSIYIGGITGRLYTNNLMQDAAVVLLNLSVDSPASIYAGGIFGETYRYNLVTGGSVSGSLRGNSTGSGTVYVGGIGGYMGYRESIDICTSSVTLVEGSGTTGAIYAGGVLGLGNAVSCTLQGGASGSTVIHGTGSSLTGSSTIYSGGISGDGTVTGSSVQGSVLISAEGAGAGQKVFAGGIQGSGEAVNSYTASTVSVLAKSSNSTATSSAAVAAGGISGQSARISNCFSAASVKVESASKVWNTSGGAPAAGGLAGLLNNGLIENSYASGQVEIANRGGGAVVFAGGLAGLGLRTSTVSVKNSAALNGSIRVDTYNPSGVHAYRVLGGVLVSNSGELEIVSVNDVPDYGTIVLQNNYVLYELRPQKRNAGESSWQYISQGANDTRGLMGDTNIDRTQNFFSGTLLWDFTGPGGARPPVWKWDAALERPVLN
jgi:hypothetical protein